MSDINQSNQATLPGFEEYADMPHSLMPDFNQVVTQRLGTTPTSGFDPHKLMVKKKQVEAGEVVAEDETPKQTWPEKDVKTLEDFCAKHGILGFNCGRMSPIAAMAMLKQKIGIVDGPLEDRMPFGYEKLGKFNPNYPYTAMVKKKTVLSDNNASGKSLING